MFLQLHNWNGGAPNMYDISGSAHFINKCDNGIVIHRNRDPDAGPVDVVQVFVFSRFILGFISMLSLALF
jgi:twinkle protein